MMMKKMEKWFSCLKNGNLEKVKEFIERDKNIVYRTNLDDKNSLIIACLYNHIHIVDYFIQNNLFSIDSEHGDNKITPFFYGCLTENLDLISYCVSKGANPNRYFVKPDGDIETCLTSSNFFDKEKTHKIVEHLIESGLDLSMDIHKTDYTMINVLYYETKTLKILLDNGLKFKPKHIIGCFSSCHSNNAYLLMEYYQNKDELYKDKELSEMVSKGNREDVIIEFIKGGSKHICLNQLCFSEYHNALKLALKNGYDVNETLLMLCSCNKKIDTLLVLLDNRIDINAIDKLNENALLKFIYEDKFEHVKILIANGATFPLESLNSVKKVSHEMLELCETVHNFSEFKMVNKHF